MSAILLLCFCSSVMDGTNSCQDIFTDMDYMSCPSCSALQQVINSNYCVYTYNADLHISCCCHSVYLVIKCFELVE